MPNRIIRDGILTSDAVNSLNWAEEVFYRRLMSVVDDHGRFHAQPKLLRAACYPLHIDKVTDADIGKWLSACETAGLVSVYPALDGKRYVAIVKFGQQVRSKSKFPEPIEGDHCQLKSTDINCQQPPANARLDGDEDEDVVEGSAEHFCSPPPPSTAPPDPPAKPPPQLPVDPPVVLIPLNDGSEFGVSASMVSEWGNVYQAVDVLQQLREMRVWALANPAKRKTRRGVQAFIVRWLGKEQDSGHGLPKKPMQADLGSFV